jgi:hypothetical protein
MTRETTVGVLVSCSFLCLVGVVVASKLHEGAAGAPPDTQAAVKEEVVDSGQIPAPAAPADKSGLKPSPLEKLQPPPTPAPPTPIQQTGGQGQDGHSATPVPTTAPNPTPPPLGDGPPAVAPPPPTAAPPANGGFTWDIPPAAPRPGDKGPGKNGSGESAAPAEKGKDKDKGKGKGDPPAGPPTPALPTPVMPSGTAPALASPTPPTPTPSGTGTETPDKDKDNGKGKHAGDSSAVLPPPAPVSPSAAGPPPLPAPVGADAPKKSDQEKGPATPSGHEATPKEPATLDKPQAAVPPGKGETIPEPPAVPLPKPPGDVAAPTPSSAGGSVPPAPAPGAVPPPAAPVAGGGSENPLKLGGTVAAATGTLLPTTAPTSPRPAVVPAAPRAPAVPQVESFPEESYRCRPGDTFASISLAKYRTQAYADALLLFNRNHPLADDNLQAEAPALQPGQPVFIPPLGVLERRYPGAVKNLSPLPAAPAPTVAAAGANLPVYRVQGNGEWLRDIARETLGNSERWQEIWSLNPAADYRAPLPPNTVLHLPQGARVPPANVP